MANTLPTQIDIFLTEAISAFTDAIVPLRAFSTVFHSLPLRGSDKAQVPYFPLATTATRDFSGAYVVDDSAASTKEVTVNKRKYQSLGFTSKELARNPDLDIVSIARMKAQKLAEDVLADIFSLVTAANYGAALTPVLASAFDSDSVIDISGLLRAAKWPRMGNSLIIDTTYETNLLKDNDIKGSVTAGTSTGIRAASVPQIAGLDFIGTNLVPSNAENLVGMAVHPSSILVAFAPIPMAEAGLRTGTYAVSSPNADGLVLEFREFFDHTNDRLVSIIECNYGFGKGETAGLKRIVSA